MWKQALMECDICTHRFVLVAPVQMERVHELRAVAIKMFENVECPRCKNFSCDEVGSDNNQVEGEEELVEA